MERKRHRSFETISGTFYALNCLTYFLIFFFSNLITRRSYKSSFGVAVVGSLGAY